ncbi:MAG: hypothetical protein DME17_06695 [Candidatus Rokuibacteriota bacterium]|nr:MAG: hypothetical protein DME17_06695 [Candidatus Rokubacteria bacterium]
MRAGRGTALPLAALAVGVAALPLLGSVFADTVMALAGLFAIVAVGLNLLFGYAGKISFGHNAFMAMGAYASGILTTGAGLPPLGALVAGAAGTGLVAFLLGAPILRLRGHYLAMATLALGEITIIVSTRWTEVTGGLTGIPGVPDFQVLGVAFDTKTKLYYLIWAVALGGLGLRPRAPRPRRPRGGGGGPGGAGRPLPRPGLRAERGVRGGGRGALRALPELRERNLLRPAGDGRIDGDARGRRDRHPLGADRRGGAAHVGLAEPRPLRRL